MILHPGRVGWLILLAALLLGARAAVFAVAAPANRAATYYVSPAGDDGAAGTAAAPWRTLQHAVDALKPGDTVLIGPGIYREAVNVKQGGTEQAPITLAAAPGAHVIVTGADRLADGWTKVASEAGQPADPIYAHDWPHVFAINWHNGVPDLTHPGDPEHEWTGRAEQVIHDGRLLRQVLRRSQLAHGTFFVDLPAKKLYVWLRDGADPARCELEASTRATWLTSQPGVSYVHVRGIIFRYAANFAQRGAFAIGGTGWVVEDCVFERTNASGASLTGSKHLFRRCVFQDNGQIGFGTSRCDDTRMEECGIYRNNTKGYSTGWEAGGLKVTMSRGFVFDRCRAVDNRGCGIWYDIGNEQSEVSHCYIADNDEAGIFYEISYGLHAHDNLVVNNANGRESPGGGWGCGGITLSSSEDCVVENNTLVGNRDGIDFREQGRSTPRIGRGGDVRILNRNHRIRNNLVAYSQAYNIGMWMDTTFFGPHPSGGDRNAPLFEDPKTLDIRFENNLLFALPGRRNYLYGVPWRPKSKALGTVEQFTAASGIPDTSRVADPRFVDPLAGDYRLQPDSPAAKMGVGVRGELPR